MDFEVGDRIIMKKPHPCGSKEWEVLRVGIDFRIRCCGCDHQIMVPRKLVEKNTKSIKKVEGESKKSSRNAQSQNRTNVLSLLRNFVLFINGRSLRSADSSNHHASMGFVRTHLNA